MRDLAPLRGVKISQMSQKIYDAESNFTKRQAIDRTILYITLYLRFKKEKSCEEIKAIWLII